jgi:hypothetical protein
MVDRKATWWTDRPQQCRTERLHGGQKGYMVDGQATAMYDRKATWWKDRPQQSTTERLHGERTGHSNVGQKGYMNVDRQATAMWGNKATGRWTEKPQQT